MSKPTLTEDIFYGHCATVVAVSPEYVKQGEQRLEDIILALNDGKTPVAVAVMVLQAALKFYYKGAVEMLEATEGAQGDGANHRVAPGRAVN